MLYNVSDEELIVSVNMNFLGIYELVIYCFFRIKKTLKILKYIGIKHIDNSGQVENMELHAFIPYLTPVVLMELHAFIPYLTPVVLMELHAFMPYLTPVVLIELHAFIPSYHI